MMEGGIQNTKNKQTIWKKKKRKKQNKFVNTMYTAHDVITKSHHIREYLRRETYSDIFFFI